MRADHPHPSSVDEVVQALMALHRATKHPLDMSFEQGQVVARYEARTGSTISTYSYRVRLLPETSEYTRLMTSTSRTVRRQSGAWSFNSRWITGPVNDTLAAHGWTPRRTALGKFFRRLIGRDQ